MAQWNKTSTSGLLAVSILKRFSRIIYFSMGDFGDAESMWSGFWPARKIRIVDVLCVSNRFFGGVIDIAKVLRSCVK